MASQRQPLLLLRQCSRYALLRSTSIRTQSHLRQGSPRPFHTASSCNETLWNNTGHVYSYSSVRTFSNAKIQTSHKTDNPELDTTLSSSDDDLKTTNKNILQHEIAKNPSLTTGQALLLLNVKRSTVLPEEIVALCRTVRAGYTKDAKIIAFALVQFKKARNLVIDQQEASIAVESILKGMMPADASTGNDKIKAALFVLDTFRDTSSGLYYATPMKAMDSTLTLLLQGVQEENLPRVELEQDEQEEPSNQEEQVVRKRHLRKRLRQLGLIPTATPPKNETNDTQTDETKETQSKLVAQTVTRVVELLCQRKERPYRVMKKKAARLYTKQIRIHHGPTPSTIQSCSAILRLLVGPQAAMSQVMEPCLAARCPVPTDLMEELTIAMEQPQQQESAEDSPISENDNGQDDQESSNAKEEKKQD